jgi:hypothetical protein
MKSPKWKYSYYGSPNRHSLEVAFPYPPKAQSSNARNLVRSKSAPPSRTLYADSIHVNEGDTGAQAKEAKEDELNSLFAPFPYEATKSNPVASHDDDIQSYASQANSDHIDYPQSDATIHPFLNWDNDLNNKLKVKAKKKNSLFSSLRRIKMKKMSPQNKNQRHSATQGDDKDSNKLLGSGNPVSATFYNKINQGTQTSLEEMEMDSNMKSTGFTDQPPIISTESSSRLVSSTVVAGPKLNSPERISELCEREEVFQIDQSGPESISKAGGTSLSFAARLARFDVAAEIYSPWFYSSIIFYCIDMKSY